VVYLLLTRTLRGVSEVDADPSEEPAPAAGIDA
jgi:hypothetical protein